MIIYLLMGLYLISVVKRLELRFVSGLKFKLPLSFKEREVVKCFSGTRNLEQTLADYRNRVLTNLIILLPLASYILIFKNSFLVLLVPLFLWGYMYEYLRIKKVVDKRRIEFFKSYPVFLNSLKLYLQAGLSLENSLELYFKEGSGGYYVSLLKEYLVKVQLGHRRREVLTDLISLSRERVFIGLLNYFIHFIELGGTDLGYLDQLITEAWKLKKETIRKLAEEASAKMVIPMMMIFIGVIILVVVPSVSALGKMAFF
ncbi:MAG: type II secretion system F family protein [Fusobacteria bacterium]|nr:type II secretion system F family protein [Fusobacteriota bacterium]